MNYLYIDFPKKGVIRDFSTLKIGDSLEVRLEELEDSICYFFEKLRKIKCNKIELEQKESNDAYGPIQIFKIL